MSYFKVGPTELRILLAIGSLVTLMVAAATHTRALYRAEPLPDRAAGR